MTPKPDGGAAFPGAYYGDIPDAIYGGMSLRDYFAAKALSGMLASNSSVDRTKVNKAKWAEVAYSFADAMLAEREK